MARRAKTGVEVQITGDKAIARTIVAIRDRFNTAIAERDFDMIQSVLCEDCTLVPGDDAPLMSGRNAQIEAWQSIVAQAENARYVRTPWRIDVSDDGLLAAETGRWQGGWSSEGFTINYLGRYFAKWRLEDQDWKIASEIFVTLKRSGSSVQ